MGDAALVGAGAAVRCGGGAPVGFASQAPFVMNATVRDNVVFGRPFVAAR